MTTLLYTHADCGEHDPGPHHPECPARLAAVLDALAGPRFEALIRREAPLAHFDDLSRVHPPRYVDRILKSVPGSGYAALDGDTILSPRSGDAALRAAG